MKLSEATKRVLAEPFRFPAAATMIESKVAAAMLAGHVFKPCGLWMDPRRYESNFIDRSDVLRWMRNRGPVCTADLADAGLGYTKQTANGVLSDLYTQGKVRRITPARHRAFYVLPDENG